MDLPFHSYRVDTASSARLVNCFGEAIPKDGKGPVVLKRSPGIDLVGACGVGPGRGLSVMAGTLYAVSGTSLYKVSSNGVASALGTIPGNATVSMANNGRQLSLIVNGDGYVYSGGGLAQISDIDFTSREPVLGKFLDNYLLLVDANSGQFFASDLADFSSYNGLQFATAEGAPDNLVTMEIDHRAAFLIGTQTCELWENTGVAGFPFERIPNGFIELGGAATFGVCKQDNSVFWIASDRTFRRLEGSTPARVSQHGVEVAWRNYARVDDAECHPYSLNGHLCIAVRFPSENATWVYDCTTQEWHERDGYYQRAWDVSGIVEAYGRVYVQRASTGEIGVLDATAYTEWGLPLRAIWAYQSIYSGGNNIQVNRVRMGIETGVGIPTVAEASGDGTNPVITLELSRKGGREGTYKPVGHRSLGAQGDFKKTVHWDALGTGRDNVLRASLSDPVPLTIWNTDVSVLELKT